MNKSIVFPGQGSQRVGMGKDLYQNFGIAKEVFNNVDDSISQKLSKLIFEGPIGELTKTENAQPAIMAVSIAILEVLKKEYGMKLSDINYCAGHSLGEYTALVATNCLELSDVAKLLKLRGLSMQNAVPIGKGSMVALLGADIEDVKLLIDNISKNYICEIANHNSHNQVVLSGDSEAIDLVINKANEKKIKAIKLDVSAPFHCQFMKKTAQKLEETFKNINFRNPIIPIVCNFTATPVSETNNLKKALINQTFSTVRWFESICFMLNHGVNNFIEIGCGSTLSNMIKRIKIEKSFSAESISNTEDIENYLKN